MIATALAIAAAATTATSAQATNECHQGYCIGADVNSGRQVWNVVLANYDPSRDKRNVYARFLMYDNRGVIVRRFAERYYSVLPKANTDLINQRFPVYKSYCTGALNFVLPESPTIYPCATWREGYYLGALIYENGGPSVAALFSFQNGKTLQIK